MAAPLPLQLRRGVGIGLASFDRSPCIAKDVFSASRSEVAPLVSAIATICLPQPQLLILGVAQRIETRDQDFGQCRAL
jgi:hypothetical protein